ncbi:THAP domain-containing protein 6-like [Stegodyphus dumicola]|uniref:THAP domain-containing protein 6-like n=1 Tax=Stegodyphus dumicola TaxID=202533 RepID=UPI0015AFFB51|nr:THAP domain-containing protein 6-like [Stegodyphus dumicola]
MVNSCVAFGCTNRRIAGSGITFHRIPKDPTLREAWIQAIRRKDWNPSANAFLCSEHFKEEDFNKRYASHLCTLKKGVVPSIFKEFPSYLQKVQKTKKVPFKRPAPANSKREFIAMKKCSNTEDSP